MNTAIANILLSKVNVLSFVDRYAGLVRPITKVDVIPIDETSEQVVRKVFPVACNVSQQQCEEEGLYADLIPSDRYRSILYFEDRGIQYVGRQGDVLSFISNLRLVCWYNLKHFDTAECSISGEIISALIAELPTSSFNSGNYQRISIEVASVAEKNASIFSAYSYSEETNQYLMYPYDYFAIDFNVKFAINRNCLSNISVITPSC